MACAQATEDYHSGQSHEAAASKILLKEYFKKRTEKGREMESQRAFCSGSHGRGSKGSADTVVRKRDPLDGELGNITEYDASCSSQSETGWHYLQTEKRAGR